MELETGLKILGVIAPGLFALWRWAWSENHVKQNRLRDEYKFAKEFFSELVDGKGMHEFQKAKGYQALAGVRWISAAEGDYLLSLKDSPKALERYVLGIECLEFKAKTCVSRIRLKPRFRRRYSRMWRKWFYAGSYCGLALLAVLPLFFGSQLIKHPSQWLIATVLCLVVFGPPAGLALRALAKITAAERVVHGQRRTTV
ncbi:hypothetical protein [Delftia acidovorans]